jgi:Cu-Zn family superoxide dismutase
MKKFGTRGNIVASTGGLDMKVRISAAAAAAMISAMSVSTGTLRAADADAAMTVEIHSLDAKGVGASIGTVKATMTPYGVLFTPALKGLPAGVHGFHLHAAASCDAGDKDGVMTAGMAAGGHFDPANTGKHEGPYGNGHLGDLPPIYVEADGSATTPVLAPRLKLSDLKGHSLMIHVHGDNYADTPEKLGGGGGRMSCGVFR